MVLKVWLGDWIEEPGYILLVLGAMAASLYLGVSSGRSHAPSFLNARALKALVQIRWLAYLGRAVWHPTHA